LIKIRYTLTLAVIISLVFLIEYQTLIFANGQMQKESNIIMHNDANLKQDDDTIISSDSDNNTLLKPKVDVSIQGTPQNDKIRGGEGDDHIDGNNGSDQLRGEEGSDEIYGAKGNDMLIGGPGNDTLTGGSGKDIFICGTGTDTITDFNVTQKDTVPENGCENTKYGNSSGNTVSNKSLSLQQQQQQEQDEDNPGNINGKEEMTENTTTKMDEQKADNDGFFFGLFK
jgi:Ca2+-binding RTX toxin-like protein